MKKIKFALLSNAILIALLLISAGSYSQNKADSAKNILNSQNSLVTIKFSNDSLEIESLAALRQIIKQSGENENHKKNYAAIAEDINKPVGLIVALIGLVISIPAFLSTFRKKEKKKYY